MQESSPELPDDDPLLGFSAEQRPVEPHVTESKEDDAAETPPACACTNESVIARVSELERQLERTVIEVANLRSDVATLVGAITDIKKRQPDRPQPSGVARTMQQLPRRQAATVAIVVAMLGLAAWGAMSVASYDLGEPPPVEGGEPAPALDAITPADAGATRPVEVQTVAAVSTVVPEPEVQVPTPRRTVPDRRAAAPEQEAPAPRGGGYVGTLSIDASPAGDVFLNRKSVGRTPVRLEKLRAGSHLVWIERDGYRRWTRVVAVAANQVARVSAELDPIR